MRKVVFVILIIAAAFFSFALGWYLKSFQKNEIPSAIQELLPEKPLEKYAIENLSNHEFREGVFEITEKFEIETENFTSYKFMYSFNPGLDDKIKKTSGMINIPNTNEKSPLVIMIRGYVDPSIYQTGVGSKNGSYFFANNGFITVAPDFLGYAESDIESSNIFESRFQTYVTILSLSGSLDQINEWDKKNIFIWAHSNGGQIALTALEVTKQNIPTTLWAPVTKPFPYSILYYTDESEDRGKFIRHELSKFEVLYDANLYSYDLYFDRINTSLQIHQGLSDDAIPYEWSREFVTKLKSLDKEVNYYEYPNSDHNLRPDWNVVIERDLHFFQENLKE